MKEIYQKNWHDFFSNSRPVARRREYRQSDERLAEDAFTRNKPPNTELKNNFPKQDFRSDKNYLNSDELNTNDIMNSTSLSESPISLSHRDNLKSANTTINSEGNLNISTSSAKRGRRVGVMRVNNTEKPAETGNAGIKPPNHKDDKETTPPAQVSSVTVHKVNKSVKLNEANNNQNDKSTIPPRSSTQVKTIKMPDTAQQERRPSICSVSVINLDKASVQTHKKKTASGVVVKKVSRISATNQPHNS
jgi:hypothetical protein